MRISLLTLPLGLFGSICVIVLVVVFANTVGKRRHAGRTLAAGFAVVLFVGLLLLGLLALSFVGTRTVVHHNTAPNAAVLQAQDQIAHAQAMADQARKQIEAQAAEIQARIQNGTSPGDRVLVEDPTTQMSQMVKLPNGVQTFEVIDENPPTVQGTPASPPQKTTGLTVAGRPWTDAVEEHQDFEADVYPSIEAAAEALGRRVGQRLVSTFDFTGQPTPMIYVWRDGVAGQVEDQNGGLIVTRELLEAVALGLRQKLTDRAYVSIEQPPTPEAIAVNVAIPEVRFESHNRWRKQAESRSGSVALRVQAPSGPFSVSTRFNDAPWVVDRTGFTRQYANNDWLVAYSDGTHTTHEDARQDALHAATSILLPLAQARISQLPASDQHRFAQQMEKDPNWLRNRVADELVSRNLVTDRFAQRFDRPYGTVWREAVLVDASPSQVDAIARSLVRGVNVQVTHQRKTWFSFIALAGLIFGTYLFLNMATKGYYTWALRFAALAGIVAAGFVLTHLF